MHEPAPDAADPAAEVLLVDAPMGEHAWVSGTAASSPPSASAPTAASTRGRVTFIVFAQRVGLTLPEIGDVLAELPGDRAPVK